MSDTLSSNGKIDKELRKRVRSIDENLWEIVNYFGKDYPDLHLIHTGSLEYGTFQLGLSPEVAKKIMSPTRFKTWYENHSMDVLRIKGVPIIDK